MSLSRPVKALPLLLLFFLGAMATSSAQTYTVLYSFTGGADGAAPIGGLVVDPSGNLYGTTFGYNGYIGAGTTAGSIFKLSPTGDFALLHNFGSGGSGGAWPLAGLVRDASGVLYGTTVGGGTAGFGTVFKLDGVGNFTVLHNFTGGKDGAGPAASLILDSAGVLYGTTTLGGNPKCGPLNLDCGIVFQVATSGKKAGKEKVLHRFSSPRKFGDTPYAPLIRAADGNFFGTTSRDGPGGAGAVFKLSPSGVVTLFHAFNFQSGGLPFSGLVQDAAGNLYGTTRGGYGRIYKLDSQGKETVLFSFNGTGGIDPLYSGIIIDGSGNLYGTAEAGGNLNACNPSYYGCGVVYKLDPSGNETVLYRFNGETDGANPQSGVIMDSAGNLYGTAVYGGIVNKACPAGCGVVFKIAP